MDEILTGGLGFAGPACIDMFVGVSLVEEKEVILIVTKSREKNQIMKAIMEQAGLDSKERTIVFSLPGTSVAGIRMLEEDIQDDLL